MSVIHLCVTQIICRVQWECLALFMKQQEVMGWKTLNIYCRWAAQRTFFNQKMSLERGKPAHQTQQFLPSGWLLHFHITVVRGRNITKVSSCTLIWSTKTCFNVLVYVYCIFEQSNKKNSRLEALPLEGQKLGLRLQGKTVLWTKLKGISRVCIKCSFSYYNHLPQSNIIFQKLNQWTRLLHWPICSFIIMNT